MIDHLGFTVSDFDRSLKFYEAALKPLGLKIVSKGEGFAGIGMSGKGQLWFGSGGETTSPIHVAFRAETRTAVDAFYKEALAAGGKDNGPPGIRAQYDPHYYAAFVLDPDGHNIEAVCHE